MKYIFKEGMNNVYKNKLMSLASATTLIATLLVCGVLFMFLFNVADNTPRLNDYLEMKVYCFPNISEEDAGPVEKFLAKKQENSIVKEFKRVSKEEWLEHAKQVEGVGKLKDDLAAEDLFVSFNVKLTDWEQRESFKEEILRLKEVEEVDYQDVIVNFITGITTWVPLICIALALLLIILSIFVIFNTVKLTVFARRKEIVIMKYVGAKDGFIKGPFIIEGFFIGLLSALLAFVIIGFAYNGAYENLVGFFSPTKIKLLEFYDMRWQVLGIFLLIGSFTGVIASLFSIRKYLKV